MRIRIADLSQRLAPALLVPLLLTASLSSGCIGAMLMDPLGRQNALDQSQRHYTNLVRWGDIEQASQYVAPERRDAFRALAPSFESIRITDFDASDFSFDEEGVNATISVTYRGYSQATLLEETIREEQHWTRIGVNKWHVEPDVQRIVDALAGAPR